jgi:UDP-N-acetylglucosamine--N-acetylmuramyl-(pentapeptide) pyrophosphoryl-undecaprenol N-acetylglucosamine transferase
MKVAIAGGGTGGHLFPGIAIAQELKARGHEVFFIGNKGRIEQTKVPEYGFEIEFVRGGQVKGVGVFGAVFGLANTLIGVIQAVLILGRRAPVAVVGVGGYASVAGVTAAWLRRITAFVCEQNSVPGRANRLLSKFAKKIFTAFPEAANWLPKGKIEQLGNPLRVDFRERVEAGKKARTDRAPCLFVFGGSQGARKLNQATTAAVEIWAKCETAPKVIHQTGALDIETVKEQYEKMGADIAPQAFIDDMPAVYAACDLVLARAGAMSITEIAACGLPSILVPLPQAADDHQRKNADAPQRAGGARVIENDALDGATLVDAIDKLFGDPAALKQMGQNALALDRPDAASAICDRIEQSVREN